MFERISLVRRQDVPLATRLATFAGGLAVGIGLSALLLWFAGVPGDALVDELFVQVFLSSDGLAQTVTGAAPLILVGLSSAFATRVRFWNIGIEGQLWWGAIAAAAIGIYDIGPPVLRPVLMLLAACLAGAAWIGLPLWLKVRYSISETVLTLLLTNIAFLFVQHLLFGAWKDPATGFPVSPQMQPAEQLAKFGWGNVGLSIVIALAVALLLWLLIDRSRLGIYARAVGLNATTAKATGLPVTMTITMLVLLSGALSGLAGGLAVAATEYRLTQFLGGNYTFSGIVIGFLARTHPLGVVVAAFCVAGMFTAGSSLKVFYSLSDAVVVLIEGIILMSLLAAQFFATYKVALARRSVAA
ncbi:ABC transporter permease [Oleomonas cavernae]|uniref:ABC transporter permease n=1 Tax=Oleomonas cavernae TaxID=2320859 RepID=A0A418WCG7_9PROT|nr:ABC transporter permease [Oleomonas cavernae]RJF87731.1 ABC transporter permease [Oleomonas cavernae]